ncbi:hypothetical protein BCR41DRAFT_132268 [Lobosporangium transversale]|uniref:Uncharacterized protein n=1 Tax=Lobosporangium transversale TaxID=64571 RepID=A0A1Y2GKB8_9FUNG|nr:hypothetical protein BCR41DRAFT_132268 [Lobosporangium transversale]ORZ10002.1 hypothetical protein BCR41DRAFT_132268 [Lobosporangium transversale]|eukprot:XP_021879092.1 hypothetical protein BCR41DRAFT_132268 [Lobosporangium transversale]
MYFDQWSKQHQRIFNVDLIPNASNVLTRILYDQARKGKANLRSHMIPLQAPNIREKGLYIYSGKVKKKKGAAFFASSTSMLSERILLYPTCVTSVGAGFCRAQRKKETEDNLIGRLSCKALEQVLLWFCCRQVSVEIVKVDPIPDSASASTSSRGIVRSKAFP